MLVFYIVSVIFGFALIGSLATPSLRKIGDGQSSFSDVVIVLGFVLMTIFQIVFYVATFPMFIKGGVLG